MKETLKKYLPQSVKNFIIDSGIFSLHLTFKFVNFFYRISHKVYRRAIKDGFDFERSLPPVFSKTVDFFSTPQLPAFGLNDLFLFGENKIPVSENIKASIIIPVFNKAEYTFQCLRALFREIDLSENEIIVIDNNSIDETAKMLDFLGAKVRVVKNSENKGFVEACNQGAAEAKGEFLVFLNNDTIVQTGWLDSLIETFERDERTGIVGSMIIYPDGHLQEAGAVIWKNGTADTYGWSENPRDLRFNFAREVDYCSGASLMISKNLFEKIGGFDMRFAPAYYEDTDLCMSVRAAGFKVIYQPASKVIHYEGVTSGTNVSSGYKRFQEINRHKFYAKWREVLEREHFPADKKNLEIASNRRNGRNIVVFFNEIPKPDRESGSVRMTAILDALNKSARVTLVYIHKHAGDEYYENFFGQKGIEIVWIVDFNSRFKRKKCDVAILCYPKVADFIYPKVRRKFPDAKIIYDTVDVHYLRLQREYEITGDKKFLGDAQMFKRIELETVRKADETWCVTEDDKNHLLREVPNAKIEIVPNIHTLEGRGKTFAERRDLFFIGSFNHRPNLDAVKFFLDEIFPLVLQKIPGVKFHIVGNNPPPELFALGSESVHVAGFVVDPRSHFENSRVFVAPLRYGAGMKGKLGQAFSHGLPVVTTTIGAEGMNLTHEKDVLIADESEKFVDEIVRLYTNETLWQNLSNNSYRYIENNFTPEIIAKKISDGIEKISGKKMLTAEAENFEADV